MNTGKAVLLSTAIVAALLGVAGGGVYLLQRKLRHSQEAAQASAAQAASKA